jgi:hypothetical protein
MLAIPTALWHTSSQGNPADDGKENMRLMALQAFLTIIFTSAATHIIEKMEYKGWLNGLAILVFVIVVSCSLNRGVARRSSAAIVLCVLAFVTVAINGFLFGYLD